MDVNVQHGIQVEIPGMGMAFFDNQIASAEEQGFSYSNNGDMIDFAAFVSTVAPTKISRFGGAVLTLSGSGFLDPTVFFQVDGAGAAFPCIIVSNDFA